MSSKFAAASVPPPAAAARGKSAAPAVPLDFAAIEAALRGLANGVETRLQFRFAHPTTVRVALDRTEALADALIALDVRPGGICVVSALASRETLDGITAAGLVPWLVDVDPYSWMFDPGHLRERLPEAPGPLEAIVPCCAFGRAPDLQAWAAFRAETGLPILVDAFEAFDGIMDAAVPVLVGLPGGQGVFLASEDSAFIDRLSAPGFDGESGLDAWPHQRLRLATAAQRLRMLLIDAPVGFQPGWGMSWVSGACALTLPDGAADNVAERLLAEGLFPESVGVYPASAAMDDIPVADHLSISLISLPFDGDLDIAGLDRLADALRRAAACEVSA